MNDTDRDQLLQSTHDAVTRIETKLFGAAVGDQGFIKDTDARLYSHNKRIRRLEWFAALVIGGSAVVLWFIDKAQIVATFLKRP